MFEAAELGRKIPKDDYKKQALALRGELLEMQRKLREAKFPVIIVFAGVDGAGKGETVNLLSEWMDPRWIITRAYGPPSDEEAERPEYWRFWRDLPPSGRIGFFLSSWYSRPILNRVNGRSTKADFGQRIQRIVQFERTLTSNGALILKFWMHLGKQAQKRRLKKLEKDPASRWRVTKLQWKHWRMYDRFIAAAEQALRQTSTVEAPWMIVEGVDEAYRTVTVASTIRDAIGSALNQGRGQRVSEKPLTVPRGRSGRAADGPMPGDLKPPTAAQTGAPTTRFMRGGVEIGAPTTRLVRGGVAKSPSPTASVTILSHLNMQQAVPKKLFDAELETEQGRLNRLQRRAQQRDVSTILVFEGWDAAGKGGAVRRVTAALDARAYQVIPIAAPTDEERAHHYLWRFWRHLSRAGRLTIFDRSWYGRVLVERVEGFATRDEWLRAYTEINEFEDQLVAAGIVLVKFWIHVTFEEQLRRFKEREATHYKQWKLTEEDWRNRAKWPDYERAVNDMVERTSTRAAPWTLVEGNDKYFARLKVLRTVCDRLAEKART